MTKQRNATCRKCKVNLSNGDDRLCDDCRRFAEFNKTPGMRLYTIDLPGSDSRSVCLAASQAAARRSYTEVPDVQRASPKDLTDFEAFGGGVRVVP